MTGEACLSVRARAASMSETASRRLFLLWLVICLPSLAAMATYAVFLSGAALVSIVNLALGIEEASHAIPFVLGTLGMLVLLAAMLGALNGLYRFVQLAFAFARHGSRALQARRALFSSGLATGAPAFLLWTAMVTVMAIAEGWVLASAIGGGPLTLSVLHLWLELHRGSLAA